MTDLAERLTKIERDQSHPNLKPRDAATLIIVDRSGDVPKVLLGKRNAGLKFMAGKLVFPGGRVDPDDSLIANGAETYPHADGLDTYARALRVAAIRETFEECGVLLARPRGDANVVEAKRYIQIENKVRAIVNIELAKAIPLTY